jgi:single-strand DNA-binding protein
MLNIITVMGRLTADPELRRTQSGTSVANFTVAVERDFGEKTTEFIPCVAWRQTGEFISKYFHKGSMIAVTGSLQSRKWQDRDGNNRTSWEINVDNAYFTGEKANTQEAINVEPPEFEELGDGEGGKLPF